MSLRSRVTAAAVIALAALLAVITAVVEWPGEEPEQVLEVQQNPVTDEKETVLIWYTDEALTEYISSAAIAFQEEPWNSDIRVIPVLETGLEYLENISRASVMGECPDLYIVGHDSLEKAYLAGLAAEIEWAGPGNAAGSFPETALNAVSYHDKLLGYPFYFETSALLYNRTYLEDMARAGLTAEADQAEALLAEAELAENGPPVGDSDGVDETLAEETSEAAAEISPMLVENRVSELLPHTLDEMKEFGNTYDAPEQVEAVFKWDINDIFYTYFFVGHSMIVGGESGDNTKNIDIYNQDAISSMNMYQNLSQFFAIDSEEAEYNSILEDFIAGKLVFTVATTDVVNRLEQAAEEGAFVYDYGIIRTPDIDEDTSTRSLSMTSCVVVNGYTENQDAANRFAYYLTTEYVDSLYDRTGKAAAALGVTYGHENLNHFAEEYARSIPLPKMIETSNFWAQLEIAFARIWNGANANRELKQLSEQIMTQVTGEPFTEELIIEEEKAEIEYLDEDALRQEAMDEE